MSSDRLMYSFLIYFFLSILFVCIDILYKKTDFSKSVLFNLVVNVLSAGTISFFINMLIYNDFFSLTELGYALSLSSFIVTFIILRSVKRKRFIGLMLFIVSSIYILLKCD